MDKVLRYRLNSEEGTLSPTQPPEAFTARPGTGPRQLSFHPYGRYAYLFHELQPIVTVLSYESEKATFSQIQTIKTIPEDFSDLNKCGGIRASPDGKYVYGSKRGHNSIVVYAVEEGSGKLRHIENVPSGGSWPGEFTTDLTGNILLAANRYSNNVTSFKIDKAMGRLTATGHQVVIEKPVFVQVVPEN